jgi:signal transduction histidine kinase
MRSIVEIETELLLKNLVHDLRQPLSTIETSVYYLNLLLSDGQPRAQEQLRAIEHQVDMAASMLTQAVAEFYRIQEESPAGKQRALTKAATAVVT